MRFGRPHGDDVSCAVTATRFQYVFSRSSRQKDSLADAFSPELWNTTAWRCKFSGGDREGSGIVLRRKMRIDKRPFTMESSRFGIRANDTWHSIVGSQ